LAHAGHLCEALRAAGIATFNVEYRRVGNPGGGWPGTFEDVRSVYRYVRQESARLQLDLNRLVVMGHSAGGQLALCLAAHETSLRRAIALAGVVNLRKAFALHLSHDAVVEFLGGTPEEVPEHYREADPMELKVPQAQQWLIHGTDDDTVPVEFSREYVQQKKKSGEPAQLIEIHGCGHFDLIDPDSAAFKQVIAAALSALA
jgi:acetyl esterase/lipase